MAVSAGAGADCARRAVVEGPGRVAAEGPARVAGGAGVTDAHRLATRGVSCAFQLRCHAPAAAGAARPRRAVCRADGFRLSRPFRVSGRRTSTCASHGKLPLRAAPLGPSGRVHRRAHVHAGRQHIGHHPPEAAVAGQHVQHPARGPLRRSSPRVPPPRLPALGGVLAAQVALHLRSADANPLDRPIRPARRPEARSGKTILRGPSLA